MKYLLIAVISNAVATVMLKFASGTEAAERTVAGFLPGYLFHPYFIFGIACFASSMVFFTKTLTLLPLSMAYPVLSSMSYAAVVTVSVAIFHERLSLLQVGGLLLIVAGLFILSRGNNAIGT